MIAVILALIVGLIVLVVSTDQFVSGASTVAQNMKVSSVLVGAIILGCGTGLPELALAFYGSHESPWRQLLNLKGEGGSGLPLALFFIALCVVFVLPTLLPDRIKRHSPFILAATITFSALLRGSLDSHEGVAMVFGFLIGIAWIARTERSEQNDPFAPLVDDDYGDDVAYVQMPVMTQMQVAVTRVLCGLVGTAIGAYTLAFGSIQLLETLGASDAIRNLTFVGLGSVLPHVVVAFQAVRQHHEGLAIGNLIGSNLFNSLVIGGLVAIIRPYQSGGSLNILTFGVVGATALLTWMLLHTDDDMGRKQGLILLVAYVGLVFCTVL